jgi:hypothetical protein
MPILVSPSLQLRDSQDIASEHGNAWTRRPRKGTRKISRARYIFHEKANPIIQLDGCNLQKCSLRTSIHTYLAGAIVVVNRASRLVRTLPALEGNLAMIATATQRHNL